MKILTDIKYILATNFIQKVLLNAQMFAEKCLFYWLTQLDQTVFTNQTDRLRKKFERLESPIYTLKTKRLFLTEKQLVQYQLLISDIFNHFFQLKITVYF